MNLKANLIGRDGRLVRVNSWQKEESKWQGSWFQMVQKPEKNIKNKRFTVGYLK